MYDITLIGYGIAHMSLLLALSNKPLKVCVVDPFFDGGDLRRHWSAIHSNTTWQQFLDAVHPFISTFKYNALSVLHDPSKTVQLGELVAQYQAVVASSSPHFIKVYDTVQKADWTVDHWQLTCSGGQTIKSKVISYSPGADPRRLNFQCPILTLEIVLSDRISTVIRPSDHIVVFGLSHSGTLAAAAAARLGAKVSAVYKGSEPFKFARDGHYDGIKQESATIADSIIAGNLAVDLIPADDHIKVCNAIMSATWVIYAVGFEGRKTVQFAVDGEPITHLTYDPTNGRLRGLKEAVAYGFGIAWPNSNVVDGLTYYDVSLSAFLTHCRLVAEQINL